MCVVMVCCLLGDTGPHNHRKAEKLRGWVGMAHAQVPHMDMMVIGTDSNGHVGNVREYTAIRGYKEGILEESMQNYPHVGYGADVENVPGRLMREFLEKSSMVAVSTAQQRASGKHGREARTAPRG